MADTVKTMFGIRTRAEKKAQQAAEKAQVAQQRSAEEGAQLEAARRTVSGVRLRLNGRRSLAFAGSDTGLSSTLGG